MAKSSAPNQGKRPVHKLRRLVQNIPDKLVACAWLLQQGFTEGDLKGYVRPGYPVRMGRVLYVKPQRSRGLRLCRCHRVAACAEAFHRCQGG